VYDASVPATIVFAFLFLSIPVVAVQEHDHPRGDCAQFSWDMARELELMRGAPTPVTALAGAEREGRVVPLEQRLDVALLPGRQVRLQAAPRREPAPDSHAGVLKLRVPRSGSYRVSASQRLWIELVGPSGAVQSSKFTMQAGCEALRKSVAFPLEPETDYWIELSGSPTADPAFLVTPDR
jgi:hypothetical protein